VAEAIWGHHLVSNHVWTVALGQRLRVWLHKLGVHYPIPTYRLDPDDLTGLICTMECQFCD